MQRGHQSGFPGAFGGGKALAAHLGPQMASTGLQCLVHAVYLFMDRPCPGAVRLAGVSPFPPAVCCTTALPMLPEVLAPAGDSHAMRAAIRAGADAVYFGLQGFNARARATNFTAETLPAVMTDLHRHGVKGFVTLNTLVFEEELPALEQAIRACARAGVDAVIVQDMATAAMCRQVAPSLAVHASTQMTCTDAAGVEFARQLGAQRVVLARELSLDDIARIRSQTDAELEVFVHGALCVSYSGQCLTSEAIGGRSANRGACAQACRLPYDLVVDGEVSPLGDVAHLISPQDLEASHLVGRLAELGVSSLKIEGRLKGPQYVGATTRLYRAAVDGQAENMEGLRHHALMTFSRGSGAGFLDGVDHQRLVEGRTCEHRGLAAGTVMGVIHDGGRALLDLVTAHALARGDGLLVEGGHAGAGETGGRLWDIRHNGHNVTHVSAGQRVGLYLGPDVDVTGVQPGRRVFINDSPRVENAVTDALERTPHRQRLEVQVRGVLGQPLVVVARTAKGLQASVQSDAALQAATGAGLGVAMLRDKLGRLGDSPFELGALEADVPAGCMVPPSSLNRLRRALVAALEQSAQRKHATTDVSAASLLAGLDFSGRGAPPPGLFVLCRNHAQALAAHQAGADGVYLDFLALTGLKKTMEALRAAGAHCIGVAPPRIRKPGEEKIDRFLESLAPDAVLVRGLGALNEGRVANGTGANRPLRIGDFSLNVTNRISAAEVLKHNIDAFTPSFDLDSRQLTALLSRGVGHLAELVVHHPMPLFHMEHCVFAALLSGGRDFRTCGRPCETHTVALRDRVGLHNPVEADIGCRNTVFHAQPQSAASVVPAAQKVGVGRFRIELVGEGPSDVTVVVQAYRALLSGELDAPALFRRLKVEHGYGVVRGSLRVLAG